MASTVVRRFRSQAGQSDWVERAGRVGLVAKGVSYGLIAILALQVAFGERRQPGDKEGILREVASRSFGTWALVGLAVGFLAYALWQAVRAVLDRDDEGADPKGLAKRSASGLKAVLYAISAFAALSLAMGSQSAAKGDEKAETAKVLEWPAGRWIVGVVGLGFLAYGAYNGYRALTEKFRKNLREHEMRPGVKPWAVRAGVVGHVARGVVFAVVGVFLTKAAVEYDPNEAVGIDGALAKLAANDYGTWILAGVAAGLLAYGFYCLVEARYRRV